MIYILIITIIDLYNENKLFFSFFVLLFLLLGFVFPVVSCRETRKNTHIITHDCKLIERKYDYNRAVTIFDCGNNGILTSINSDIFRKAKEYNKLEVEYIRDNYRILKLL